MQLKELNELATGESVARLLDADPAAAKATLAEALFQLKKKQKDIAAKVIAVEAGLDKLIGGTDPKSPDYVRGQKTEKICANDGVTVYKVTIKRKEKVECNIEAVEKAKIPWEGGGFVNVPEVVIPQHWEFDPKTWEQRRKELSKFVTVTPQKTGVEIAVTA